MSDRFRPITMAQLTSWIFRELETNDSIFGIPRSTFWTPKPDDPFRLRKYGELLDTPFGVAAGPHSQMAQNIVVAWLCGARFIELKTVQTLDELEIAKPCIDMEDEGYNCEWSQELKVHESYDEYLRAWVLIHALHHKLGFPGERPGIIFNLSVGYNLEGIKKPNVQWYLDKVADTSAEKGALVDEVARWYPEVRNVAIPDCMSDSMTLSTMHGCPPDEIESISRYLIDERNLHTSVKLNPTLLGPDGVRKILNEELGYEDVEVPDEAFGHDLKYVDAIPMLRRLGAAAMDKGVVFGVKLSNTLEVTNHRDVFPEGEKMMYLSGRPLAAITGNLAARLSDEFGGRLLMSYAGGADAFNMADLLAAGMKTVTVCTDILKSGGYLRMKQYMENTASAMAEVGAKDLDDFVVRRAAASDGFGDALPGLLDSVEAPVADKLVSDLGAGGGLWAAAKTHAEAAGETVFDLAGHLRAAAGLHNLRGHAVNMRKDHLLHKEHVDTAHSKTPRKLELFDCIEAPCVDECPVDQDVPQYMAAVREGRIDDAVAIARADSAIPAILGRICDRKCEDTCIRTHYDEPLAIREIKRFIMDRETTPAWPAKAAPRETRVGIIGAGPCGVTAANYLARAGYRCTIFEQFDKPGGMVSGTIPSYRLPQDSIDQDMRMLSFLGVEVRYGQTAGKDFMLSDLRKEGFEHIIIGTGAQLGKQLGFANEDAEGVIDAIGFLREVRDGGSPTLGDNVIVVGAGDVAMDAARTVFRLPGEHNLSLVYRRTISQMPADPEEVEGLLEEGIPVYELASPDSLVVKDGKLEQLICQKMELGPKAADGRRRPVPIEGEKLTFPCDMLLLAISQRSVIDFFDDGSPEITRWNSIACDPTTLETSLPNVYTGGDVAQDGPSSAVKASADGKIIAAAIRRKHEGPPARQNKAISDADIADLIERRGRRQLRTPVPQSPLEERRSFGEVILAYSEQDAIEEASRCLDCDTFCSLCVGVCPNLAFITYKARPIEARLPELVLSGGEVSREIGSTVHIDQGLQVLVLTDFCNECGNCATFCPTSGRPYVDKPRLYLDRTDFDAEANNAFMILDDGADGVIHGRFEGQTHELKIGDTLRYRTPSLDVGLDRQSLAVQDVQVRATNGDESRTPLVPAAYLLAVFEGVRGSLPWLPNGPDSARLD